MILNDPPLTSAHFLLLTLFFMQENLGQPSVSTSLVPSYLMNVAREHNGPISVKLANFLLDMIFKMNIP